MHDDRWWYDGDQCLTDEGGYHCSYRRNQDACAADNKCCCLNDDYTPMEFVVHVLERFFGVSHSQAVEIMLTVHKKGVAVVGVFSYEIAETKVAQVMDFARRNQHPLQCTMEKED